MQQLHVSGLLFGAAVGCGESVGEDGLPHALRLSGTLLVLLAELVLGESGKRLQMRWCLCLEALVCAVLILCEVRSALPQGPLVREGGLLRRGDDGV